MSAARVRSFATIAREPECPERSFGRWEAAVLALAFAYWATIVFHLLDGTPSWLQYVSGILFVITATYTGAHRASKRVVTSLYDEVTVDEDEVRFKTNWWEHAIALDDISGLRFRRDDSGGIRALAITQRDGRRVWVSKLSDMNGLWQELNERVAEAQGQRALERILTARRRRDPLVILEGLSALGVPIAIALMILIDSYPVSMALPVVHAALFLLDGANSLRGKPVLLSIFCNGFEVRMSILRTLSIFELFLGAFSLRVALGFFP